MSRLIIVSNRLPVSINKKKDRLSYSKSVGGLATGLGSFYQTYESFWVGWPGVTEESITEEERVEILAKCKDDDCYPVFLEKADIENYYYGFSNKSIWPLFHYFTLYAVYSQNYWESYKKVNQAFCDVICEMAKPDDIIWVHDYHLMLLPRMLKQRLPQATIGYFLHIPFPSFEIYRLFPWRKAILRGVLGADLVGFHTYDYVRHFFSCVRRILGYEHTFGHLYLKNRVLRVDAFPMGINYEKFAEASNDPKISDEIARVRKQVGDRKVILSVDRLDYSKGILERLEIFDLFLERNPDYIGKVSMILVAVPSRTGIDNYMQLKRDLDELVGRVNGKYGKIDWQPVMYLYRSLPFPSLMGMYSVGDVALITPIRDGMNLIAKEYIAAKQNGLGVMILSETAGASNELSEAIVVNPNNKDEMVDVLKYALEMPEDEQRNRNQIMQNRLSRYNVVRWANDFMGRLVKVKEMQQNLNSRRLAPNMKEQLLEKYKSSQKRLILLDYDGTLISFADSPEKAKPDEELMELLRNLIKDDRNEVVVISGRNKEFLDDCFKSLHIALIAEHGVWVRQKDKEWGLVEALRNDWKDEVRPIMEQYVDSTPKSFLEEKDYSLVWHYRRAVPELATVRARELMDALLHLTENLNLGILEGNKVLEIKNLGVNKGSTALKWVDKANWDFIFFAGDDNTDEDVFAILPEDAFSIKVGIGLSRARFNVDSSEDIRNLINEMTRS